MKIDFIWCDGFQELEFWGPDAFQRAHAVRELFGYGKIWRRMYGEDGLLEAVTDVTNLGQKEEHAQK
jgi:hypothetical protein